MIDIKRSGSRVEKQLDQAALACAQQGKQFTALRRAVFALILQAKTPATAYELLDRLRATHKAATPATVYRALEFLSENVLIHKVESLSAFIPCAEAARHNHAAQLYICRQCGTVAEHEDRAVAQALGAAAAKLGFQPANIIVEIEGVCARCAAA
ncbi:MAG: Fur family transcriptional regulator [Acidiphilium sp.]|nr:Fur family transcriptional regulator [Acidiphilium sp.]MDD4935465.1 Fur family transcriptional regulator [Acidiphilium sp.]